MTATRVRHSEFFATKSLPIEDKGEYLEIQFCRDQGHKRVAIMRIQLTRAAYEELARDMVMGRGRAVN